jgi:uncharacterized protein YdeI (YjbR/CyaY-like superfamily)
VAKTIQLTQEEHVENYLNLLEHPLRKAVEALREIVLETDKEIGEQIKWNSLAFYYTGKMKPFDPREYKRDIVVFNLGKKDFVLLVFPTGVIINDKTGILEGKFKDTRKIVKFTSLDEVKSKKKDLQYVIRDWLKLVDR